MRSEIILFCQRDFTTNAADERSLILDSASRFEQVSQEHQDNASTNSEELPGDLQEKLQREQHVSYCDQDLTKDIILALRSVGDSLDARMTPGNEVCSSHGNINIAFDVYCKLQGRLLYA